LGDCNATRTFSNGLYTNESAFISDYCGVYEGAQIYFEMIFDVGQNVDTSDMRLCMNIQESN